MTLIIIQVDYLTEGNSLNDDKFSQELEAFCVSKKAKVSSKTIISRSMLSLR